MTILDSGTMIWAEVAKANVDWFEFWAMDAHLAIQKNNPADLEDDSAAKENAPGTPKPRRQTWGQARSNTSDWPECDEGTTMVSKVAIHKATSTIIIDSVTFNTAFDKVTINGGHPDGPVFTCDTAQAVISKTDADLLVAAGAVDLR